MSKKYDDEISLDDIDLDDNEDAYTSDKEGSCSLEDCLGVCINEIGKVDIRYMAFLSGASEDEVIAFHKGKTIFQDPLGYRLDGDRYGHWMLEAEYMSGNLYELLKTAERENVYSDDRFGANIRAIKERMPDPMTIEDIHTRLGASWIYERTIREFVQWLMQLTYPPTVEKVEGEGKWRIHYNGRVWEVLENATYGTSRMPARKIIQAILNASTIKVYDEIPDPSTKSGTKRVVNPDETFYAQNKAQIILDKFQEWISNNPKVAEKLAEEYYRIYCYAVPRFNGDVLSLKDMNPAVQPYKHQTDAAMRILLSPNTVLCHDVGSGKTFCYVIALHEMYRLGISKKNMVVVPNPTFRGSVDAHKLLYPQDKILEISPADFSPGERAKILKEMKNGDYTAIYIAYSKFDMLGMSKTWIEKEMNERINAYYAKAREAAGERWKVDTFVSCAKNLAKKRDKILEEMEPDDRDCFDELGITTLVVDECQNYKNINIETKLDNVVGMHTEGSRKAEKLRSKVKCVRGNGGKIVFATGTLLTNSIADLFVTQIYLQQATLDACEIGTFGEWTNTFGSTTTNFEMDVNGQGFRYMSRISHYHNLPELMALFGQVCDFYHINKSDMQVPEFKGFIDITVPSTTYLEQFNQEIVKRTDQVRKKPSFRQKNRKKKEKKIKENDNILTIVTDGRKAALDIRLVNPDAVITRDQCKAGACAKEVLKLWKQYPEMSQIIFCDFSTPKDKFNVYDEVKRYLIAGGMPEERIAYIHDGTTEAKKNKLLENLDNGTISVMIGSTAKLGVGVNVQQHLIALHHIDAPWRPSDLTQREGRLIRQGNLNKEVFQYRYITERSFDAYVWQILENKQRFISSFLAGSLSEFHRDESEIDQTLLDIAEVKALAIGNPLIRHRVEAVNRLERARIAKKQRDKQLRELQAKLLSLPKAIEEQTNRLVRLLADRDYFQEHKVSMNQEDREAFGEELLNALGRNHMTVRDRKYDTYMGFEIIFPKDMDREEPFIYIRRPGSGVKYSIKMKDKDPIGATRSLDGTLLGIAKRAETVQKLLADLRNQRAETEAEFSKGNPHDTEVELLRHQIAEIDKQLEEMKETGEEKE